MIEIIRIKLIRNASTIDLFDKNRILGKILITYTDKKKFRLIRIDTLEHRDHIFQDGHYKIKYEYSPKFKKNLWELKGIPNRSEIKIHSGYRTSHTLGCILIGTHDINRLHSTLDNKQDYTIQIETI